MHFTMFAVFVTTVAMFAVGAVWYMVLFAKQWGEIHGFDKVDKKTQKEMQKKMGPMLLVQLVMTMATAWVLARLIVKIPDYSAYWLAFIIWLGFILPTQVSGVLFGGTEPKWVGRKILILAGGAFVNVMVAALILKQLM